MGRDAAGQGTEDCAAEADLYRSAGAGVQSEDRPSSLDWSENAERRAKAIANGVADTPQRQRQYSEEEVALIIKRAAELQQTEQTEQEPSTALSLIEVE